MATEILRSRGAIFSDSQPKAPSFRPVYYPAAPQISTGANSRGARAIDIHHHYFPPELIDEDQAHGKTLGGVEYFPPKQAKDNPLSDSFPKGQRLAPDVTDGRSPQSSRSYD